MFAFPLFRHLPAAVFSFVAALLVAGSASHCAAQDIEVKSGEKIAFLGDSITQAGNSAPGGYIHLVISGLKAVGVNATPIPAGISGHKSNDMLTRLDRDVISKKPDWMTLSCGVNDVWHGANGVPLDKYKENITKIVDQCQAANIKVMILTSTMITEDAATDNNKKLAAYNDFLRELAKEKKCLLADLNAQMQTAVKLPDGAPPRKGNLLTADGVHMNALGNVMMASGIVKAFGVGDEPMKKVQEAWFSIPNAADVHLGLTLGEYKHLSDVADAQHISVQDLIHAEFKKSVDSLSKADAAK